MMERKPLIVSLVSDPAAGPIIVQESDKHQKPLCRPERLIGRKKQAQAWLVIQTTAGST